MKFKTAFDHDSGSTTMPSSFRGRPAGYGYELLGLILFILFWIIGSWLIFTRSELEQLQGFLPAPTFAALVACAQDPSFWFSVFASLRRILVGICLASLMGFPIGILLGSFSVLRRLSYLPVQFLRMISPLSWMPIALLLFTSFEGAVYFLILMATIFPIILNTTAGVLQVNPQWIRMAVNQGAKNFQLIRTVLIPASVPHMFTSLRLALGVAWIVLVPAEFLGVTSGLGYLINDARDTMEYDKLMALVIAIGILGFSLDKIFEKIQNHLTRSWKA